MGASNSKSTDLGHGYSLQAYFSQGNTDVSNNKSSVYVEAKLSSGGTNWSSGYNSYIRVYWHDNRENYDRLVAETAISSCAYWSSYYASGTIDVYHKDDGTLSGYAYATFSKGGTSSYAPNSGGVATDWTALWTIARASTPSVSGNQANLGSTVTINTNRASSSFTHTLSYKFGETTGTIASNVGASTNWAIPNTLANQIPNASEGNCTITCVTYNGNTNIGAKTYTLKLKVPDTIKPTTSNTLTVSDGNSNIASLNLGVYLTDKSQLSLSFTGNGVYDSTISKYCAKINNGEDIEEATLADLNTALSNISVINGTNTIEAWVIDSRGKKSTSISSNIIGRLYTSPIMSSFIVARCDESKKDDDENVYGKISFAGNVTDIKGTDGTTSKNAMYCKYRYKDSNSNVWSNLVTISVSGSSIDFTGDNSKLIVDSNNQSIEFSTSTKYDIELYLYDKVSLKDSGWSGSGNPTEAQLAKLLKRSGNLLTGFDLMHFNSSGKAISIGKKSEATGYSLLTAQPSNWSTNYKDYYTKSGNNYIKVTGNSAPTWAANTYYKRNDYKWYEVRMDQIRFEGDVYVNNTLIEFLPIGTILPYSSTTIPSGYMVCDGRAISREDYSELFDIIGTAYGSGDGSTTFNLPNLKGRIPVGQDIGDTSFDEVGKTGGEKTHILTIAEMPSHDHTVKFDQSANGGTAWLKTGGNSGGPFTGYGYVNSTGGGQAHNNLQPYVVLVYIIKVASGNATIPSSVTITNADVLQINTNKNDITTLKEKTNHIGEYIVLRRNSDLTWWAGGQSRIDKFQFTQVYSSYGTGLTATDTNQRVLIGAGVNAVRVTYHLNKDEGDFSNNWIMGYIYKNDTVLKRSITKAEKWAQLDDTMIIPVQQGDIIGVYVQTDLSGSIVFPTYDSFVNCGGMQILNVEVVR